MNIIKTIEYLTELYWENEAVGENANYPTKDFDKWLTEEFESNFFCEEWHHQVKLIVRLYEYAPNYEKYYKRYVRDKIYHDKIVANKEYPIGKYFRKNLYDKTLDDDFDTTIVNSTFMAIPPHYEVARILKELGHESWKHGSNWMMKLKETELDKLRRLKYAN